MHPRLRLSIPLLLLAACADEAPASIDAAPKITVSDAALVRIDSRVLNAAGEALPKLSAVVTAVSDPALLKLGNNGELQCQGYGTASATITAGGLRHDVVVECMLIQEIRAEPGALEAVLVPDEAGVLQAVQLGPVSFTVIGLDGQPIQGAPVVLTASDPNVITLKDGGMVEALRLGKASIKAVVGDKIGTVEVSVAEELTTRKGLVVDDSKSVGLPLEPGSYRVTMGSDQGVKLSFEGARTGDEARCAVDETNAAELLCTLAQAGTLEVANPGVLGMGGGAASVNLRVVRLP